MKKNILLAVLCLLASASQINAHVIAGNTVDGSRTPGDETIKKGFRYEIEASGEVQLEGGFSVERGAVFAIYPSSF